MLHSFMITSGRGGIVLYRKTFTKVLNQPRLIAGLVTALCDFSVGSSIELPVSTIELENFSVSVVQLPAGDNEHAEHTEHAEHAEHAEREILRIVLFHDSSDGDLYGHVLGLQLLSAFHDTFGDRVRSGGLGHTDGVEDMFKGFAAHVRPAVIASVRPLMELLESHDGIKSAFLIRHRADGGYASALSALWYAADGTAAETVVADVQALLDAADDVMAAQRDQTTVVTLGPLVRIERLGPATLVVTAQPPATCMSCQRIIDGCTTVLKQRTMSAPQQQQVGRARPPQPPSNTHLHNQQHLSQTQMSITDLAKRIDDFLSNLEAALHLPYDLAHAQKDYEGILVALNLVHKNMSDQNMLNVSPDDAVKPNKPDASPEALLKAALERKSTVDAEFDKIVAAASAAKARADV